MRRSLLVLSVLALGCDPGRGGDAGLDTRDASSIDATTHDASTRDARLDVLVDDSGPPLDANDRDAGEDDPTDAFTTDDAFTIDDAFLARDAFPFDVFTPADAFAPIDAFTVPDAFASRDAFVAPDARMGAACLSGVAGTHVVRFRWDGSGAGSTAYVRYEANTLPDTSRWRVTANSRSIGYRPVFDDIFLGEGGLDLSGTGFIDVELSFGGLSSLSNVTLAIYGRSFSTGSSGSFEWQTFDGTGGSDLVANSAPYEWYDADATDAFTAGDDGILLRIYPGPPSGSLIVNRVELCITE